MRLTHAGGGLTMGPPPAERQPDNSEGRVVTVTSQKSTVVGVFQSRAQAEQAVRALRQAGFAEDHGSLIGKDVGGGGSKAGAGAATGGAAGAGGGGPGAPGQTVGGLPRLRPHPRL